jgi:hypothetical protein
MIPNPRIVGEHHLYTNAPANKWGFFGNQQAVIDTALFAFVIVCVIVTGVGLIAYLEQSGGPSPTPLLGRACMGLRTAVKPQEAARSADSQWALRLAGPC